MNRIYSVSSWPSESVSGATSGTSGRSVESRTQYSELTPQNDFATSTYNLECTIQAVQLTKVLNEAIYKTKMSICLPKLVSDYYFLNSILSENHKSDLLRIFELSDNHCEMDFLQPELSHLIYIMNSYPALKPKINEMIAEIKLKHENQHSIVMPRKSIMKKTLQLKLTTKGRKKTTEKQNAALEYLRCLEQFTELMVRQVNMSAAEELAQKFKQQSLEKSNSRYMKDIQVIEKELRDKEDAYLEQNKLKIGEIMKLEKEINHLKAESAEMLRNKILDSEIKMVLQSRTHEVRAAALKHDLEESKAAHEALLDANINSEKSLRLHRFKVETQLKSWVQKYDLEMVDKQEELDEFIKMYKDEMQHIAELEKKIVKQNLEYIPLMQEREDEYEREMLEKMTKFQLEHAARVFQTAWRRVLAHRQEMKKLIHTQDLIKDQLLKQNREKPTKKGVNGKK